MLDFRRLANENGLELVEGGHHHCVQGWIQTHCPLCTNGTHGFHLGFNLEKGNFNCWRCGSVKYTDVISGLLRVSRERARQIAAHYQTARPRRGPERREKSRQRTIKPPQGSGPLATAHWQYLRSRGFGKKEADLWEMRGTRHLSGPWNWRLIFPIQDVHGTTVAWMGRAIGRATPKYRLTDDSQCLAERATFLYGAHKVQGDSVIVVEGPADVWNIGPGAVALLGVDWKLPQANLLRRFERRFIMLDPEPKAQRKALELAQWLAYYPGHTEIIEGIEGDPGSLNKKQVKRIRKELLK